ncbi:MAG: hypothetical protein ACKO91_00555 [Acidimicrobiales bacterium]
MERMVRSSPLAVRRARAVVAGLVALGLLAACGSSATSADTAQRSPEPVATSAPGSAGAPTTSAGVPTTSAGVPITAADPTRPRTCPDKVNFRPNQSVLVTEGGVVREVSDQAETEFLSKNCNGGSQPSGVGWFDRSGCVDRPVRFTAPIIAPEHLAQITPLGRMYDSHVTPTSHQYWQPQPTKDPTAYPVYAPSDGWVVGVELHPASAGVPGPLNITTDIGARTSVDEFQVIIELSCGVLLTYNHLRAFPPDLLAQASLGTDDRVKRPTKVIRIPVRAGQQVGMAGESTIDVSASDKRVNLRGFVRAESYTTEPWKTHTIDPLSLYDEPLRSTFAAKVSRSAEPVGGRIDYDVPGRAVGNWFREGTGGYGNGTPGRYWDGHLSLAYDPFNPSVVTVSTGNFLGPKSAQFMAKDAPDPATVDAAAGPVRFALHRFRYFHEGQPWAATTVSKAVVVEPMELLGYLLVAVQPDGRLKAQFFGPDGATAGFTDAAALYER